MYLLLVVPPTSMLSVYLFAMDTYPGLIRPSVLSVQPSYLDSPQLAGLNYDTSVHGIVNPDWTPY